MHDRFGAMGPGGDGVLQPLYTAKGTYLTELQLDAISTTDICTSALSVMGCVSILVFAVVKKKVCDSNVQPLFHLALADFLASGTLLVGCVYHKVYLHDSPQVFTFCSYLSGVVTGLFVITFLLTSAYAAEVYMRVSYQGLQADRRGMDQEKRRRFEWMYFAYSMSWVFPIACVVCLVGYYSTVHQDDAVGTIQVYCNDSCVPFFMQNNYRACGPQGTSIFQFLRVYKYFFLVPLLLAFTFNLVAYVKAFLLVRQLFQRGGRLGADENHKLTRVKKHAALFLSIFFICWLPTLLLGIISSAEGETMDMRRYYPLYLAQAILSPLQGLLNTLGYGWQRREFKQLMCPWMFAGRFKRTERNVG